MANLQTVPWHKRPIGWHANKLCCDIAWKMRSLIGFSLYHHFLDIMIHRYKINYYGQRWP